MKSNILTLLKNEAKNLTSSQLNVADHILKDPTEAAFLTIEQLARAVGTSTTTIMRLTVNLGYSGYADFQKALREVIRTRIPHARLKINLEEVDRKELLIQYAQTQINNISSTVEALSDDVLKECIQMILSAEIIYCTGLRMSYAPAQYLYYGLNRLLGKSRLLKPGIGDLPEQMMNITPSDVLIAFSFPRYIKSTIEIAELAKERGAKVIAVTDGYASPIVPFADVILPCSFESVAFQNSNIGAMFVADCLISAIAFQESEATNERLKKVESYLKDMNYHLKDDWDSR